MKLQPLQLTTHLSFFSPCYCYLYRLVQYAILLFSGSWQQSAYYLKLHPSMYHLLNYSQHLLPKFMLSSQTLIYWDECKICITVQTSGQRITFHRHFPKVMAFVFIFIFVGFIRIVRYFICYIFVVFCLVAAINIYQV